MLKTLPILISLLAPALTGILLALAFPNYHQGRLAWVAFVPLLLVIRKKRPWPAFFMGWLCGVIFFLGITPWWIKEFKFVSPLASGLGYLYLGFYFGLFGLFLSWFDRNHQVYLLGCRPLSGWPLSTSAPTYPFWPFHGRSSGIPSTKISP